MIGALASFTAVKNFFPQEEFVTGIAAAVHELRLVEGRIKGVLPGLRSIFVEGLELSRVF